MESNLSGTASPSESVTYVTRKDVFLFIRDKNMLKAYTTTAPKELLTNILQKLEITELTSEDQNKFGKHIQNVVTQIRKRWKKSSRTLDVFLKKESAWLSKKIELGFARKGGQVGRLEKVFEECSTKVKRRKVADLLNRSAEELSLATQIKLHSEGERVKAGVIKKAINSSPKSIKAMNQTSTSFCSYTPYTAEEALALITDLGLTKHQYKILQQSAKNKNVNLYPSYESILKEKKQCYPPDSSLCITESSCVIHLQTLLDYTINRFSKAEPDVFQSLSEGENSLLCYWKWGCDGSGGHSLYKQSFLENDSTSDSNILMTSIVPLEIKRQTDQNNISIWKNYRTSATRYCRPIRFAFEKETFEKILEEFARVELQINELQHTTFSIGNKTISVKHLLMKTMVDGKTCNAVMKNRASSNCYICHAHPKEMNDLDKCLKKKPDTNAYELGLSVLHAQIRFFETCLHISYKLNIRRWQARGDAAKLDVNERKIMLQNKFRSEMGLLVDIPKQGGGNTNDGNTARKFFKNPEKSAEITGIELELIERFSTILKTLSCGLTINVDRFKNYCLDTAKFYVEKYSWYPMPVSVHKVLIHGAEVINHFPLPIGELTEDVQETRQKDFKKFREAYSRKMSRIHSNTDILNKLLITSDPVISKMRIFSKKILNPLPPKVVELLDSEILS